MTEYLLAIVSIALLFSYARAIQGKGSNSVFKSTWQYLSYYTILSNILVCIWLLFRVKREHTTFGIFFNDDNTSAAIAFYIFTVGLANYLIFGWQDLTLSDRISDLLVHAITPLGTLGYWVLFVNKSQLDFDYLGYWLIYPVGYAIYTILHGQWSGFYPYEFTNLKEPGLNRVLLTTINLTIALIIGGSLFILFGQAISGE